MRKVLLTLLSICLGIYAIAQDGSGSSHRSGMREAKSDKIRQNGRCPKFHLALSSGLNNNTGILGLDLEYDFTPHISGDIGGGIGSWGSKTTIGAKYFVETCHLGWAFGAGITRASGLNGYESDMQTVYGTTETVKLDLYPQTNFYIAAYKYWNLGRRYSRFYTEIGWSVALTSDKFVQTDGSPISDNSAHVLKFIAPGGFIAGLGFCFALGGR